MKDSDTLISKDRKQYIKNELSDLYDYCFEPVEPKCGDCHNPDTFFNKYVQRNKLTAATACVVTVAGWTSLLIFILISPLAFLSVLSLTVLAVLYVDMIEERQQEEVNGGYENE